MPSDYGEGRKEGARTLWSCAQHELGTAVSRTLTSLQGWLWVQGGRLEPLGASGAGPGALSGRTGQVLYLKGRLAGMKRIDHCSPISNESFLSLTAFKIFTLSLGFRNLMVSALTLSLHYLEFTQFLESVVLCLSLNLKNFQPFFCWLLFQSIFYPSLRGILTTPMLDFCYCSTDSWDSRI